MIKGKGRQDSNQVAISPLVESVQCRDSVLCSRERAGSGSACRRPVRFSPPDQISNGSGIPDQSVGMFGLSLFWMCRQFRPR